MPMVINVDGELLGPADATVPVLDRGFLYGDSVYEVFRTYGGRPFLMERHLDRLERSAARLHMQLPPRPWLVEQVLRTLEKGANRESYCRIIVTRGSGPITLDPLTAEGPRSVIIVKELVPHPAEVFERGIRLHIPSVRRNPSASLDPAIKSGNYLNSILALGEARRAGFDDALMLDMKGRLTEASTSNVFVVLGGKLCTPPLDVGILDGITRGIVIELARSDGMEVEQCHLFPEQLRGASEMMLTGTLREVMPVVEVDGLPIGQGRPGPVARRLLELLRRFALEGKA